MEGQTLIYIFQLGDFILFFKKWKKKHEKTVILSDYFRHFWNKINQISHNLELGTSLVATCNSIFVKVLKPTYESCHLMLINDMDPCQWTNLRNLKKKTLIQGFTLNPSLSKINMKWKMEVRTILHYYYVNIQLY